MLRGFLIDFGAINFNIAVDQAWIQQSRIVVKFEFYEL